MQTKKTKNQGKQFEQDFKNSVPGGVNYYRLRDSGLSLRKAIKCPKCRHMITPDVLMKLLGIRFTNRNIADCILMDGKVSCFLELKSYSGKSVSTKPIIAVKKEGSKKAIFDKLAELVKASFVPNVAAGYIFNMRDCDNQTYYLTAKQVDYFITYYTRKSIPISFMQDHGVPILSQKKKVHYTYDIPRFLKEAHVSTYGQ
jgi:recombination protein U